jgi:hypothetical protein
MWPTTGFGWRDDLKPGWIISAILQEHAEFLNERKGEWLWYGKNHTVDNEASLFEAIDVIHFMLTLNS